MVKMKRLENGDYVPEECYSLTNPATSGGKSEIDDVDLPCGTDCGKECSACIIQHVMNDYARSQTQERDVRICPVCGKEVDRADMLFTKDCHGIAFRLLCRECYEFAMLGGYDGEYYDESDEQIDDDY